MNKLIQRFFRNAVALFICFVSLVLALAPAVSYIAADSGALVSYAAEEETAAQDTEDSSAASEEKKDSKETSAKTVEDDSDKEAPRKDSDNEAPKEEPKGDQGRSSDAENAADTQKSLAEQTLTADGSDYHISVSGMLPEGTRLEASEIEKKKQLSELEKEAAEKIFEDDKLCDADSLPYARFFDISIIDKDGNEYEPEDKVSLSIDLKDDALETKDVDITAVHFDKKAGAELIPVDIDGSTASLEAESFSTYGVVYSYTVDFYYTSKDGKASEYHMNGGSEMMLSDLFDKLGINRKTSDIKSLEFTDESLVSFTKESGDYRIKSLRPFTTGEQLNITFKDGSAVIIRVEDASADNRTPSTETNINWNLTEDGTLTIRPSNNKTSAYFNTVRTSQASWDSFWKHSTGGASIRSEVKKVIIQPNNVGTGITLNKDKSHLAYMFSGFTNLESVEIKGGAFKGSTKNLGYMFKECTSLTEIKGLENLDTTDTDQMQRMFSDCTKLTEVNISSWKNDKTVSNMQNMFNGCKALETVKMPGKDFKVKDGALLAGMFEGCTSLTSVDFGASDDHDDHMDVTGAKTMTNMFKGCTALKTLDVSTFGTLPNIVNMDGFVNGCTALEELNISNMDNSAIQPKRGQHEPPVYGHDLGINTTSTPNLKTLEADNSKVYMCKNNAGSPSNQYFNAAYDSDIVYFTDKQAKFTPKSGDPEEITTKRDYIDLITDRHETGERGKDGHSEAATNNMYGLNTNGAGFLAPGKYEIGDEKQTDPKPENIPPTRFRVTEMGSSKPDIELLNNSDGLLIEDGDKILTAEKTREFWESQGSDYVIDGGGAPLITITYPKVAKDFYGNTHDVVITINKITFKDIGLIPGEDDAHAERKHNTNYYANERYYRTVLEAKNGSLEFQNYVYSEHAERWWNDGVGDWKEVGLQKVLSNGSGTDIDFDISVSDAPERSTMLFYIDDLDVPASQTWVHNPDDMCYDYLPWSGVTYGAGSEGMVLRKGNNLDTITFGAHTGLQMIKSAQSAERNDYVVATGSDPGTSWSEFYVQASATKASYTWTSGIGCTTYLLKNTAPPEQPKDAVLTELKAEKVLSGRPWRDSDKFDIELSVAQGDKTTPMPEGWKEKLDIRYSVATVGNDDRVKDDPQGSDRRQKSLGKITYTIDDLKNEKGKILPYKTFKYTIRELEPEDGPSGRIAAVTYSDEEYEADVKVVLDDKTDPDVPKLVIESVTYKKVDPEGAAGIARFTNTYAAKKTEDTLEAKKDFHDVNQDKAIGLKGGDFEFALKPIGANASLAPMPAGSAGTGKNRIFKTKNDGDGLVMFKGSDEKHGLEFDYQDLLDAGISAEALHSKEGVPFEYELYEVIPEAGKNEIKTNNGNSTWSITNTRTGLATVYDGIHHTRKITVRVITKDDTEVLYIDPQPDTDTADYYIDRDGTKKPVAGLEGYDPEMHHETPDGDPIFVNFRFQQQYADIRVKKKWVDKNDRDGIRPKSVKAVIKSDAFRPLNETLTLRGLFWSAALKDQPVWKFDAMYDEAGQGIHTKLVKVEYTLAEKQGGVINGDVNTGYAVSYNFKSPFTLSESGKDKVLTITNTHVPDNMYLVTYEDGEHGKSDGGSVIKRYGGKPQGNTVTPAEGYRFTGRYEYVITNKAGKVIDSGTTDDPRSIVVTGNIVFTPVYEAVTGPDGRKGGSASSGTKTGDPNGTNLMLAVIGLGAGLSGLAMAVRSRRKRGRA